MATNGSKSLNLWDNYVQIINGKSSPTERPHRGINPATLEKKPDVPIATQEDLNQAVDAARKAFKSWSKVPWEERKKKLFEWADAIEAQKKDFADLLISEQGKPVCLRW
jgi:acyl-CoA reductase-like NAD-dependent aldehyde dehydrogenase